MVKIYALVDPRTNEIRYVGKTSKLLKQRLASHLWTSSLQAKTHKSFWLLQLLNLGLKPKIKLLARVKDEDWEIAEQDWIRKFVNLTNLTPGGDGYASLSEVARKKISIANSKVVYQYSLLGEFLKMWNSATEAANYYNLGPSSIASAANPMDRKHSAAGYLWSKDLKDQLPPYQSKSLTRVKVIFPNKCVKIFDSLHEAATEMGVIKGTLSGWLQEDKHYWHKHLFYYEK